MRRIAILILLLLSGCNSTSEPATATADVTAAVVAAASPTMEATEEATATPSPSVAPTTEAAPSPTTEPTATAGVVTTATVAAQCDALIDEAMARVGDRCDGIGRNEVCYGNRLVEVEFRAGASEPFEAEGDVARLGDLRSIRTMPLDVVTGAWGIAVIKAQVGLAETVPGQNVTFLLFGDAQMDNPTPDMRNVTIRTGIGEPACEAAPSAVLAQTPAGERVAITINGADVVLGSTAYITARPNDEMIVAVIEGQAEVSAFGETRTVTVGTQVRLPMGDEANPTVTGPPSEPEPYDVTAAERAPVALLDRPVTFPSPMAPRLTATPTATATPSATSTGTPCVPRADWTGIYRVQSGDTLGRIAERFGVTVSQLQAANCLRETVAISAGQGLRVPRLSGSPTPTRVTPTATPAGANPQADRTTIAAGECTTVRWETPAGSQVFFEGQPTSGASRTVCPTRTQTYTVLVVDAAGGRTSHRITITVEGG